MPDRPVADPSLELTAKTAGQQPFMPVLRDLAQAFQAFCAYEEPHIRQLGLTPPQFDVIATLGNTSGLLMNQLAEKTLVTKGTLTGIVDRLEQKGLVRREVPPTNRRCFLIVLTPAGAAVFESVFPRHIAYLKQRFDQLSERELGEIDQALQKLKGIFH
jgi:MarR family transcriptional regulator, 2-MHQ and catechol-resistance regulon repressor